MAQRGKVPKREAELARPMARRGQAAARIITRGELKPLIWEMFPPDEEWHPKARLIWDSAISSGQTEFWQNSDVAMLYMMVEEWSAYLKNSTFERKDGTTGRKVNPVMLQSLTSLMSSLLMTEGDRRRVRLELTDPGELNKTADGLMSARQLYAAAMEGMEVEK